MRAMPLHAPGAAAGANAQAHGGADRMNGQRKKILGLRAG